MEASGTPGTDPGAHASRSDGPDAPDGSPDPAPPGPAGPLGTSGQPVHLTGGDAVRAHVTLVVGLALCAVAFWFEIRRALGGNGLSWAYVFEWPLFAVFAVYMWWSVLHGGRAARRRRAPTAKPAVDPRYAGMLEAWEAHQRELQAAQAASESTPDEGGTGRPDGT